MGTDHLGHLATELRQVEVRLSAIEHARGVVHLTVAQQVHDSPLGVCGRLGHAVIVAKDSETALAAAGSAASTRSTAASSCDALTNHVSKALGGRCTPWLSMDWNNAEKACVCWALAWS